MYNLLPLIIILISFIIILAIIIRKFPMLAVLDVENIPAEKEAKMKEKIIKERLQRDIFKVGGWLVVFGERLIKKVNKLIASLHELREKHQEEKKMADKNPEEKIDILLEQSKELNKKDDFDDLNEAEKKLIEVISLDSKNLAAFIELGEVYFKLNKYEEAKQTFVYALKLWNILMTRQRKRK